MMSFKRNLMTLGVVAGGLLALASTASAQTIERSVKAPLSGLYEVVFNPADNGVYVAATGPRGANAAQVVQLDAQSLEQVGRGINTFGEAAFGLALNATTQTLYGTATGTGSVIALDVRTGRVQGIIRDGETKAHVRQAVVDEARNKIYVSIVGGEGADAQTNPNVVWVIDGATNTLERKISTPVEAMTGITLDAAANRLYVTGLSSHNVAVIDLNNDSIVGTWTTGGENPINAVVDPAGNRLFVVNGKPGELAVLDTRNGRVLHQVATGEGALSVAYNAAVNQVYVANRTAGTVTVIDSRNYNVLANLATGTFPQTIAIDRATNAVYVTNKARGLPRNAPTGTPVPVDPTGDVVTIIRP